MKSELLKAAGAVIPNQGILVNMVSRRVRQLMQGHRPLVEHPPGLRAADIALMEIGQQKLSYELAPILKAGQLPAEAPETNVVEFPAVAAGKKKAA
ncbi:hypothetical protein BH20VER2_BH20VER2_14020 [soil metagenome]